MLRFDWIVVILEIVEEGVVVGVEDCSRDGRWFCENIPGRGMVLASLISGSELSVGQQEVEVVTADVILSQVNDRHCQTLLPMVVSGVFRDVADELSHLQQWSVTVQEPYNPPNESCLDFLLEFPLEATPDDLPLTGFETVTYGWDGSNIVRDREKDELLVDEIGVRNLVRIVVEIGSGLRMLSKWWDYAGITVEIP